MKLLILPILLILFYSCTTNEEILFLESIEEDYSSINDPKERWEAYNFEDYYIRQSWHCQCEPPYGANIYIKNNTIFDSDFIYPRNSKDAEDPITEAILLTVNDAFDLINKSIITADTVIVEYHPRFGYPTYINIDPSFQWVDEEILYKFEGLKRYVEF